MENTQTISDISKETLTFLAYFNNEMINKIPNSVIIKLCEYASDSTLEFFIDPNKNFENQKISEESKDLISLIYYNYIADEVEKKEIENRWNENDKNFEIQQKKIYNSDNLFENSSNINKEYTQSCQENSMIEYKESLLKKIFIKIKNFFKI